MRLQVKLDLTKFIESHEFTFDAAFGAETSNLELYDASVKPLVAAALSGAMSREIRCTTVACSRSLGAGGARLRFASRC